LGRGSSRRFAPPAAIRSRSSRRFTSRSAAPSSRTLPPSRNSARHRSIHPVAVPRDASLLRQPSGRVPRHVSLRGRLLLRRGRCHLHETLLVTALFIRSRFLATFRSAGSHPVAFLATFHFAVGCSFVADANHSTKLCSSPRHVLLRRGRCHL